MARIVIAKKPMPLRGRRTGLTARKKPPDDPDAQRRAHEWIAEQLRKGREAYDWSQKQDKD
jgi:hypothetical protein